MLVWGSDVLRMMGDAVETQVMAMVPVVNVARPSDCQVAGVTLALEELRVWRRMRNSSLHLDLSEHLVNAVAVEASENPCGDPGRVNDAEVNMIGRPASDSWNVGAVGNCVDDHGQSGRVGRVHGHCLVFHGHDRGRGCSYVRRDHRLCRVNGRGHGPFDGRNPSCLARSA